VSVAPIEERVGGILRDSLSIEVPAADTDLIDGGLLDSLALVSLIAEIEADFGIELPLDDFDVERFRSVRRIAEFVGASAPPQQA
jgi:acyl carrier protein